MQEPHEVIRIFLPFYRWENWGTQSLPMWRGCDAGYVFELWTSEYLSQSGIGMVCRLGRRAVVMLGDGLVCQLSASGSAQPTHACLQRLSLTGCMWGRFWAKPCCLGRGVYREDISSTPRRVCFLHPLDSKNLAPNAPAIQKRKREFMLTFLGGWKKGKKKPLPSICNQIHFVLGFLGRPFS